MDVDNLFGLCLYISTCILIADSYPEKRFLLAPSNGHDHTRFRCFPPISYCHLRCTNGFRANPNGCPICQCAPGTQANSMKTPTYQPQSPQSYLPQSMTSGYHLFSKPCQPQQMFCSLVCRHGYLTGNNGCHFCLCASVPQGTSAPTTTSGPLTLLSNPCISSQRLCGLSCYHGYLKGPGNCDYCLCAPADLVIATLNTTAATPTVSQTTPTSHQTTPTSSVVLPNPCVANQSPCAMPCANGFVKGPRDCQYCLCAPRTTTTTRAPMTAPHKPVLSHDGPVNSSVTSHPVMTTVSPDVSNECIIATTICQLKCPGGFMTDPQRCTFCVCKDDMYNQTGIQKAEEPTIQLLSACVEGLDVCRIFCMEGYLRGPNNCQYCACRH